MSIGLYVHIPFCIKKCKYCDFVSYPYDADLAASYVSALIKEIEMYGNLLDGDKKRLASIYMGGGTPSLLGAAGLERIFNAINQVFRYEQGTEITVEANPGTVDRELFCSIKSMGCNRLSLGVQSAEPRHLECLGRAHSREEAERAFVWARLAGFKNINVDLIFGIPGQNLLDWAKTIEWTLVFRPEHISAYGLKIEEGTPFHELRSRGELPTVDEEVDLKMFFYGIDTLKASGYEHYEISNFCQPGKQSVHNMRYWRNMEYLGVGVAAHSFLNKIRSNNHANLQQYISMLKTGHLPIAEKQEIGRREEISETVFLGLRTIEGLNIFDFYQRFDQSLEELFPTALDKLEKLKLVTIEEGFLRLTRKGLPLANEVFAEFV